MAFIDISDVVKNFGPVTALDHVSLKIERGEFFSLLGPSGCGKTTLLRMLAGFEHPDSGGIIIDGVAMNGVPPEKRPGNMVFQSYAIFPHLNVFDNIAYGLRTLRLSRVERKARVEEALRLIRLEGYGSRKAHELSGGQRQRVALARALVRRPSMLLLDEPLSALDKKLREEMQRELVQLQRELGITFIFVTHDQEEALSMSSRIAVMFDGKLAQVADPRTLYEQPASARVADFIGAINFIDETTAIRPEKVRVSQEIGNGKIRAVSYLGDRAQLLIDVQGYRNPISALVQHNALPYAVGDSVAVSWSPYAVINLGEA